MRTRIGLGVLGLTVAGAAVAAVVLMWGRGGSETVSARPSDGQPTTTQLFSYAVKFICGYYDPSVHQEPRGYEGPVKPGNYATEINIHNPNYFTGRGSFQRLPVLKKLVYLWGRSSEGYFDYREPKTSGPTKFSRVILRPDYATMDDCNSIYSLAKETNYDVTDGAFTIGFLVILSPKALDVTAAYTAQSEHFGNNATPGTAPLGGTSIEIEQIAGKRIAVPTSQLPGALTAEE
jgi:hypothetical protein